MLVRGLQWIRNSRLGRRVRPASSAFAVLFWWEIRRPAYNALIGVTGLLAGLAFLGIGGLKETAGVFVLAPGLIVGVVMAVMTFMVIANVCYTGGWIAELIVRRAWPDESEAFARTTFTLGLVFSMFLAFMPPIVLATAKGATVLGWIGGSKT